MQLNSELRTRDLEGLTMPAEATIRANRPIRKKSARSARRVAEGLHHSGIPSVPSQADIPSGAEDAIVRNEADSRADSNGPGSAKRPCRRWGQSCETKPIFPQALYGKGVAPRRRPTGILRNKAHSRRRAGMGEGGQGRPRRCHWVKACETKPIPARTAMGQGWQGAHAPVGPIVPNKANFTTSAFGIRSYVMSATHGDSAKQSQLPRYCGFREICRLW